MGGFDTVFFHLKVPVESFEKASDCGIIFGKSKSPVYKFRPLADDNTAVEPEQKKTASLHFFPQRSCHYREYSAGFHSGY